MLSAISQECSTFDTPTRKVKSLYSIYESYSFALNVADPIHFEEAVKEEVWRKSIKEELDIIESNNTWELVSFLEGKKTISLKWIYMADM